MFSRIIETHFVTVIRDRFYLEIMILELHLFPLEGG